MKSILLTNGGETYVDDEDYDYLIQWNWYKTKNKNNKICAITRSIYISVGELQTVHMAREIAERMRLDIEDKEVDHKDRNPINNVRNNLRVASHGQNTRNQDLRLDNTSGYKGVTFSLKANKWQAQINKNKEYIFINYFITPEEAAKAYDLYVLWLEPEFAVLNFPELRSKYQQIIDEILK